MKRPESSRRGFLKAATVAGYRTGRVAALADGRAEIEGCDTTFEPDAIGNLNTHVTGPCSTAAPGPSR